MEDSEMLVSGNGMPTPVEMPESTYYRQESMGLYDWQRMFEAAKSILSIETQYKGDAKFVTSMETTPEMVELSKGLITELLKMANGRIVKTKYLSV